MIKTKTEQSVEFEISERVLLIKINGECKCQYMNVQKVENKNVHFIR